LLAMELNTTNEKNSAAIIHVYDAKGISRVTIIDFTTARVTKVSTVVLAIRVNAARFKYNLILIRIKIVSTARGDRYQTTKKDGLTVIGSHTHGLDLGLNRMLRLRGS
ncbi:hypothetical protein Tco_1553051, partial [Tanacetum coccineum]